MLIKITRDIFPEQKKRSRTILRLEKIYWLSLNYQIAHKCIPISIRGLKMSDLQHINLYYRITGDAALDEISLVKDLQHYLIKKHNPRRRLYIRPVIV